jgi:NADH dehydrogenase
VQGSAQLFQKALAAGIKDIFFISTISSFKEAQSHYGKTKYKIEELVMRLNGTVISPGLIWNQPASGGMFGTLTKAVLKLPLVPVPFCSGSVLFPCNLEDFKNFFLKIVTSSPETRNGKLLVAAENQGYSLGEICSLIAQQNQRKILLIPIHWLFFYVAIKVLEMTGLKFKFRSDSLISLVHSNKKPLMERNAIPFDFRRLR